MIPKLFTCMKTYSKETFLKDVIAGIIVAIIALPLSIALGIASGVSPEKGLITAIIGGFFVSLLGGSRVQIGGPTGAFVIIVLGIVSQYGIVGLSIASMMAGVILVIMGICGLGKLVKFIPYPITTGFTSGIAVVIFSTQIKDFMGLPLKTVPSEFIEKWQVYIQYMPELNWSAFLIGLLTIFIIIAFPKLNKKMPPTLIAIFITTALTQWGSLDIATIQTQFGEIKSNISLIEFSGVTKQQITALIGPALSIAILGSVESLLSAVVADGMIGGNHRSNIELVGQGAANIFSGLFGGIPVTGAIARTAANVKFGGRTPVAGMVHATTLLIMMLVLMPYVKYVPMASLAGILLVVAYNMGEWEAFLQIKKCPKSDALVFLITFSLTVLFDLVIAIQIGMVLAAFLFMKRMSDVTHCEYIAPEDEKMNDRLRMQGYEKLLNHVAFYEVRGPFFFGAADRFIQVIRSVRNMPKILVLNLKEVPIIDATGYAALERFHEMCEASNTTLVLMDVQKETYSILDNYGFVNIIGSEQVCDGLANTLQLANHILQDKYGFLEEEDYKPNVCL